jgi:hypothetical protein
MGCADRDRGGEVINRLRHDARPVDRVDARERDRSRNAWWLNNPFTIAWHVEGASIASAWTLPSAGVVIIRRCTSEMVVRGNSTNR